MNFDKLKQKVSFHTLGCKLNFSETSTIARQFTNNGFERVNFNENADVVVLNTCTVTGTADKKCRQAIKKAKKISPDSYLIVTGCYAQTDAEKIAEMREVDAVLGVNNRFRIFEHLKNFNKSGSASIHTEKTEELKEFGSAFSSDDRTRSFLKVQDGCDYPCTYCTIPKARGKSRNKTIKKTIADAEKIAELGFKEIILTGVNIGDFGKSTNESFINLIKELEKVKDIERYRISSIEPNLLTNEIIEFVSKSEKFLPHFHIPLQSGCNRILKLMKRRYMRELFAERVNEINTTQADAFIGVDVIVGFPGESDNDFIETYTFLEKLNISFLHVFSYSERKGTLAAGMKNKVPKNEIKKRSGELHKLSEIKHKEFYQKHLNKIYKVLFERTKVKNSIFGFTDNYIKIEHPFNKSLINNILNFKITGINNKGNAIGIIVN